MALNDLSSVFSLSLTANKGEIVSLLTCGHAHIITPLHNPFWEMPDVLFTYHQILSACV